MQEWLEAKLSILCILNSPWHIKKLQEEYKQINPREEKLSQNAHREEWAGAGGARFPLFSCQIKLKESIQAQRSLLSGDQLCQFLFVS